MCNSFSRRIINFKKIEIGTLPFVDKTAPLACTDTTDLDAFEEATLPTVRVKRVRFAPEVGECSDNTTKPRSRPTFDRMAPNTPPSQPLVYTRYFTSCESPDESLDEIVQNALPSQQFHSSPGRTHSLPNGRWNDLVSNASHAQPSPYIRRVKSTSFRRIRYPRCGTFDRMATDTPPLQPLSLPMRAHVSRVF